VFFSYLADYINIFSIRPATGVKSYQNISATMWGAELGSQVSLPYNLFLKGSLSYTEGKNQGGNRPLSEIPPLRGMIAIRYDNGTMFAELAENLAAKQSRVDQFLLEQPTGGWATTDLKIGVNYKNLTLYAGVNNLFDKFYYNYLSYQRDPFSSGVKVPENGRNFYVTLQYRL